MAPLGSSRYEKPELTGEAARNEMDAAERRKAELPGNGISIELETMPAEDGVRVPHELYN